jgi:hypothetical protein
MGPPDRAHRRHNRFHMSGSEMLNPGWLTYNEDGPDVFT